MRRLLFRELCAKGLAVLMLLSVQPAMAVLPTVDAEGRPFPSLAPMLKEVNPAVVNISTYSTQQANYNPLLNDPFFRRFFNIPDGQYQQQRPQRRQHSAGSGVIVDAGDGIVVTNNHVIARADEVQVSLLDGRSYEAEVLGTDPDLDIAILQIDANELTQVAIADSNDLEVGDFVVAIGNPFGLGQTVTTGVVSALGRSGVGIVGYENFIQTDASINPGNSGGALVNLQGELVGINTAIITPGGGGNVGIGFAIPSEMAQASMEQIVEHGEVKRGQIGIGIQDITTDLRRAFAIENGRLGVLVTSVSRDSPAERAGLEPGDIVLEVDGRETHSTGQLRSQIGTRTIGDEVILKILREGRERTITVEVAEPASMLSRSGSLHKLLDGVQFEDNPRGTGVVVANVDPNSRAANSGLRPGDVVMAVNQRRVSDLQDLQDVLARSEGSVLLHLNRRGGSLFLVIR